MNKKGKNKKGYRTNPNATHVEVKSDENIQVHLKENVESVDIERIPGIVSETVTAPMETTEENTPKKPKRSKGKKKKDINDIISGDKEEKPSVSHDVVDLKFKTDCTVAIAVEENPETETIMTSMRKKKNKNKINEPDDITEKAAKDDVNNTLVAATEIKQETIDKAIAESTIKASKKKNKKKKRIDSEKSEKENILSCVTTVANLVGTTDQTSKIPGVSLKHSSDLHSTKTNELETLNESENESLEKPKGNLEPSEELQTIKTIKFETLDDCDRAEKLPSTLLILEDDIDKQYQHIIEVSKCDSKSKKKNKKDKKLEQNKTEKDESNSKETITPSAVAVNIKTKANDDISTPMMDETKWSEENPSCKPKTKKVKPVDDRCKGKTNIFQEFSENIATLDPLKTENNILLATPDPQHQNIKEQKFENLDTQNLTIISELNKVSGDMSYVPDTTTEKKRKKGLKASKPSEAESEIRKPESTNNFINEPKLSTENCPISETVEAIQCFETSIITEPQTSKKDKNFNKSIAEAKMEEDSVLLPQNLENTMVTSKPEIVIQQKVECKHKKKQNKSLKHSPQSEEVTEATKSISGQTTNIQHQTTPRAENADVLPAMLKSDDIEIRSLRGDESECSTCDVTSEILHPRARSQQVLDDNNNMVIREIFTMESNISSLVNPSSVDIPKIPVISRKIVDNMPAVKEGKSDLKSKMMEVNQDMEGLRLSIEKSLAEFTAMEKCEAKVAEQYESAKLQNKIDKTNEKNDRKSAEPEDAIPFSQNIDCMCTNQTFDESIKNVESISKLSESELKFTEKKISDVGRNIEKVTEPNKLPEDKSLFQGGNLETKTSHASQILLTIIDELPQKQSIIVQHTTNPVPPVCPARKDHKGKHKKKKGIQDSTQITSTVASSASLTTCTSESKDQQDKKENKPETQSENKEKSKQQDKENVDIESTSNIDYEPIDNFEDALTSSIDDVNETFEMMITESNEQTNPKINIIEPDEEKPNPVTPPKNLLGNPNIPVRSSRRDYKKEKDKRPNDTQAKVKINDSVEIETKKSKNTQTIKKMIKDCTPKVHSNNDEFVYKYSFRRVFLQCSCHVCKKDLSKNRVACGFCSLVFYCSSKHKDGDWPQHQALCFAVSTLVHLKDQKHIYADTTGVSGHDYRLTRMQMIVSCEKVLKRRLVPWEQEALLYPRMCANLECREWRQGKLEDCEGCGQISYCADRPEHLPKTHQRWCKSYSLYQKLVCYQQTKGRLEPMLPTRIIRDHYQIPEKMNEVLASMFEEKIDMNDIQYAALTQIATAPLTAAFADQIYRNKTDKTTNGVSKKTSFTIHVVGAELQFEADALNKWEVFYLHLRPELQELRVVLINYNLNPSNLPLDLLGKIKLCENCRLNKRRVVFSFQDKRTYTEYRSSEDFDYPDLICAFNPSIQRSSIYNGADPWPASLNLILKLRTPFLVTAYTMTELQKDAARIKECSDADFSIISEPKYNNFASVRPDRNFISDDEMPLLFKNYCFLVLCGYCN